MTLDDETLMAYADGEHENAAEIEAALASQPALAARVKEMRALRKTVSGAFAPIANEPPPAYLSATLCAPPRVTRRAPLAVIKPAPLSPFIILSAAAVALIAVIATEPNGALIPPPLVTASSSEGPILIPPVIAPTPKTAMLAPSVSPLELAPLPSPPPTYAEAVWVEQPDAQTIERYYPARAAAQNIKGKAVLDCRVNDDRSVGCVVDSEEPGDWGFGAAAIDVARHFLIAEKAANGMRTADGRITIPITFAPRNCVASPSAIALGVTAAGPVIADLIWVKKPSANDLARFYPVRALEREKRGQAIVRCLVGLNGALTNCVVTSETPRGWGFGAAAIKMAQHFRTAPQTAKGQPTAGRVVSLPITFKGD